MYIYVYFISGDQNVGCAESTKSDVSDLVNDVTANEDDPKKIVKAIEKGLQQKEKIFLDLFDQDPVIINPS